MTGRASYQSVNQRNRQHRVCGKTWCGFTGTWQPQKPKHRKRAQGWEASGILGRIITEHYCHKENTTVTNMTLLSLTEHYCHRQRIVGGRGDHKCTTRGECRFQCDITRICERSSHFHSIRSTCTPVVWCNFKYDSICII